MRGLQTVVDTALKSSASDLSSAVSTSIRELRSGEWSAFKSELDSAGIITQPRRVALNSASSYLRPNGI